jgi:cation diffusion facilitator CzcD-associated flavoprotein CzcO
MAVATHLRAAGLDVRIFGKPMDFWSSHMPKGMWLRSPWEGTHIADPDRALTLDRYEATQGGRLSKPIPLEDFVSYGLWFQRQSLPDLDQRTIGRIERNDGGFRLTLEDGDRLSAERVIVATGIGSFANYPAPLAPLPRELVSHTSDRSNRDLGRFAGRRVVVVGSGQSALESAALMHEAGAEVEVLVRQPRVRFLKNSSYLEWLMDCKINPFQAPGKIGPIGINWLIEQPTLFTLFPRRLQAWMAARAIRPAGSSWLRSRTAAVTFRTRRHVLSATVRGEKVHLHLNDGTDCEADHVLLGTGYKIAIARYGFLSQDVLQAVRTVNGYPVLNRGFESSLPGMYFVGTTSAYSFGPLSRFVAGTPFTAATLASYAVKKPVPRPFIAALATSRSPAPRELCPV